MTLRICPDIVRYVSKEEDQIYIYTHTHTRTRARTHTKLNSKHKTQNPKYGARAHTHTHTQTDKSLTGEPILPVRTANQYLARYWFAVCSGKIGSQVRDLS